jgi:hypothetical protein
MMSKKLKTSFFLRQISIYKSLHSTVRSTRTHHYLSLYSGPIQKTLTHHIEYLDTCMEYLI